MRLHHKLNIPLGKKVVTKVIGFVISNSLIFMPFISLYILTRNVLWIFVGAIVVWFFPFVGTVRCINDTWEANQGKKTLTPQEIAKYKKWTLVWKKIKGEWERTRSVKHVTEWLEKMHPKLAYERRTISKIIRKGEAGELDQFM